MRPDVAISRRIHVWEGKSASNQPCESSNASPACCGQDLLVLVALWGRANLVTAGTVWEHVCLAASRSGRNSRRPDPDWCRRSLSERRIWVFPLGYTTVQDCWMLPRSPDSQRQEMFCCNPSWHVGSLSCQHTDLGVGTSGWSLVWTASVKVCRRWWSYILRRLRTTTLCLIVLETDLSTNDHSNRSWTNVARPCFLLSTDPASEKLVITRLSAVVQWVSCRTMMKALLLYASCSATAILFAVSPSVYSWSMLGRGVC